MGMITNGSWDKTQLPGSYTARDSGRHTINDTTNSPNRTQGEFGPLTNIYRFGDNEMTDVEKMERIGAELEGLEEPIQVITTAMTMRPDLLKWDGVMAMLKSMKGRIQDSINLANSIKESHAEGPVCTEPRIDVFITRGLEFRMKVTESGQEPYEVTVGGRMWTDHGKGRIYERTAHAKIEILLKALMAKASMLGIKYFENLS
jgi:hypothetical protein